MIGCGQGAIHPTRMAGATGVCRQGLGDPVGGPGATRVGAAGGFVCGS